MARDVVLGVLRATLLLEGALRDRLELLVSRVRVGDGCAVLEMTIEEDEARVVDVEPDRHCALAARIGHGQLKRRGRDVS